jgi:uncharacterized protein (TIGR00730 family)
MYGAASDNIDVNYFRQAEAFGRGIGKRGFRLIYGGGGSGLMGAAARGVRAEGGDVISVVPNFMYGMEDIFSDCTQMIRTNTMAERKSIMEDNGDAFVIVPGGIGTFDEFFQILALVGLKQLTAPIILFNIDGYYNILIALLEDSRQKGFISYDPWKYITVASTVQEVLKVLDETAV